MHIKMKNVMSEVFNNVNMLYLNKINIIDNISFLALPHF